MLKQKDNGTRGFNAQAISAPGRERRCFMQSVKKSQFAQWLAEKITMPKKQANEVIDAFVEGITTILKRGDKLNVTGLGIFKVADRPARMGRNPRTGETIQIKASKKVRFTASKVLKEAVL